MVNVVMVPWALDRQGLSFHVTSSQRKEENEKKASKYKV